MRYGKRIGRRAFCVGLAILAGVGGALMSADSQGKEGPADLIIHEWGTFLGMNGSDGASLDGMYHEEHALPAFVHSRGRDQLRLPFSFLKGETPVIYFYSKERQHVSLGVRFPRGVWTQWYPQASMVSPSLIQNAETADRRAGGMIHWEADVIPPSAVNLEARLPATSGDALWNHARNVDAAYVTTSDGTKNPETSEFEKFLFYRGLGEARLPSTGLSKERNADGRSRPNTRRRDPSGFRHPDRKRPGSF